MPIRSDFYRVVLHFPRLFPDPAVFEDQPHLVKRYFMSNGLSGEKAELVLQTVDEVVPIDDRGKPSVAAGTAKFRFEGRSIVAEYMSNATIRIGYADFGTGLGPDDHSRLWSKGKLGEQSFELREFKHQSQVFDLPDVAELYKILKEQATPSTMSTIEIDKVPEEAFNAGLAYLRSRLTAAAKLDGLEVEIYAARNLSSSEKAALERRLTRESTKATIFVILSRESSSDLQSPIKRN